MTAERSVDVLLGLTFDGRPITAQPGQSVAAALLAAGVRAWRTTRRRGRPRGVFCGIGVCHDCLLTVDGHPDQRACLVPARDGMSLTSTPPGAEVAAGGVPSGSAPPAGGVPGAEVTSSGPSPSEVDHS